jgi:hypothetical protein
MTLHGAEREPDTEGHHPVGSQPRVHEPQLVARQDSEQGSNGHGMWTVNLQLSGQPVRRESGGGKASDEEDSCRC